MEKKKRRDKMTYHKPKVSALVVPIKAIESITKHLQVLLDSHTHVHSATPAAYEADE
jgi:hypothetical protein